MKNHFVALPTLKIPPRKKNLFQQRCSKRKCECFETLTNKSKKVAIKKNFLHRFRHLKFCLLSLYGSIFFIQTGFYCSPPFFVFFFPPFFYLSPDSNPLFRKEEAREREKLCFLDFLLPVNRDEMERRKSESERRVQ